MSARAELKNVLIAALEAAFPDVAIVPWSGEEAIFNAARQFPSLSVAYAGTEFGEHQETGEDAPATYARDHVFHLFISTQNAGAAAGDDHAMEIMEKAEQDVSGRKIADRGIAELVGEELVNVHLGRFLYVQTWKINLLESH